MCVYIYMCVNLHIHAYFCIDANKHEICIPYTCIVLHHVPTRVWRCKRGCMSSHVNSWSRQGTVPRTATAGTEGLPMTVGRRQKRRSLAAGCWYPIRTHLFIHFCGVCTDDHQKFHHPGQGCTPPR